MTVLDAIKYEHIFCLLNTQNNLSHPPKISYLIICVLFYIYDSFDIEIRGQFKVFI